MAQRDKVKELVGRGLHSYHTKALQQIDRIEKKNKEQNHKISILSNELDNDYLTKTEEGSVISLEHSKEGMVYLDELQGNTLVNYCTDGSKELTLNGDIDVEGTFVTTTEGVDNGKVDIICEGNTLVNIFSTNNYNHTTHAEIKNNITYNMTKNSIEVAFNKDCIGSEYMVLLIGDINTKHISMLKPNQKYTLCFDVEQNYDWTLNINCKKSNNADPLFIANRVKIKNGRNKITMTTLATLPTLTEQRMYLDITDKTQRLAGRYLKISNLVLVENEEDNIIPYFEGMKSVGQDDENGHKIEILSKNKNLFPYSNISIDAKTNQTWYSLEGNMDMYGNDMWSKTKTWIYLPRGYIKVTTQELFNCGIQMVTPNEKMISYNGNSLFEGGYVTFRLRNNDTVNKFGYKNLMFEWSQSPILNNSNYIEPKQHKKEILLNEPLRGLPNGIKDRLVKIGGKWYIERNCGEVVLDGSEGIIKKHNASDTYTNTNLWRFENLFNTNAIYSNSTNVGVCNKFIWDFQSSYEDFEHCRTGYNDSSNASTHVFYIWLNKSKCSTVDEFRTWMSNNPVTVVYQLVIPIYEELELEPTLNTYINTTHISNNSTIPCNMKIINSGYNAIIKPSTLYTVALDTNKSGTVGMNLGGVKGTTTNNVLTLTTPATLTDDSLRLYGKGIKGSKVRLLEGDKTNWTPSHFEGMQSSFEDKLQEDGTYKMEILSNNRNLLNMKNFVSHYNIADFSNGVITSVTHTGDYGWVRLRLKNTYKLKAGTYYLQFKMRSDNYRTGINHVRFETVIDTVTLQCSSRLVNPNCTSDYQVYELKFIAEKDFDINYLFIQCYMTASKNFQIKDLMLSRIQSDLYIPYEINKIQFSSIEPLRSVDNIKDRFIFKDNKLMIERNCKEIEVNGSLVWYDYDTSVTPKNPRCYFIIEDCYYTQHNRQAKSDKFTLLHSDLDITHFKVHAYQDTKTIAWYYVPKASLETENMQGFKKYMENNPSKLVYPIKEPTYEEVPFELQKIILEGYENGTLFFDTNIPPTSTVTYAGETPIVKATKLNKTEVLNNTNDINDNIVPYLMDMDYRVVCLQLQSENINDGVSMARLFGGAYEMLQRDIQSKRYSVDEYRHRLDAYLGANKITEDEYNKLGDMLNE